MPYWDKKLPTWTTKPDLDPNWKITPIGAKKYYGKKIGIQDKSARIGKIVAVCLFSIALAPVSVPAFLMAGTYRKLIIWTKEVKHSTSIKAIAKKNISSSNKAFNPSIPPLKNDDLLAPASFKDSAVNPPIPPLKNCDLILPLLTAVTIKNSKEARDYLQTLYLTSKTLQPFVDEVALDFVNRGVISIFDLPGINGDKEKALAYLKTNGPKIRYVNISLSDQEVKEVVANCPMIETLLMKHTSLTNSGIEQLAKLSQLKRLSIRSAQDLSKLENLKNLEELEINTIESSLKNFEKMDNLKILSIYRFDDSFSLDALTHLEDLYLGISFIYPNLDQLTNLKVLHFSSDEAILGFPSLDQLKNLESLTVNCSADQEILDFPSLDQLKNLENLTVNCSSLTEIPSLNALINLKILHLSCRQLTAIPAHDALANLEDVKIDY